MCVCACGSASDELTLSFRLPSWGELLDRLAKRCMSGDDLNGLAALPFIDQARVIGERMGGTEHLAAAIAQECRSPVFSVSHALLASLPIKEVVTSNYDVLFEEVFFVSFAIARLLNSVRNRHPRRVFTK